MVRDSVERKMPLFLVLKTALFFGALLHSGMVFLESVGFGGVVYLEDSIGELRFRWEMDLMTTMNFYGGLMGLLVTIHIAPTSGDLRMSREDLESNWF